MEWNEYKMFSEKTLSTEFHCGKKVENLLHGVIGVLTELEELLGWNDEVNKKEEVADIFWYLALLDRELGLNFEIKKYDNNFTQVKSQNLILQAFKQSCLLLDLLKKKIYYNKNIDTSNFGKISSDLFETMSIFCHLNQIEIPNILDTNIQKLKARYGDQFTSERAINRDLEKERVILEQ